MRARVILLGALLAGPAMAADLDEPYPPPHGRIGRGASIEVAGFAAYAAPRGPYVVAPPAIRLVVPPPGPPPGLAYAPPPVYRPPPPLIAAVPIIGPYLVPAPYGPPPATVLDAYDHRYDYNQ